MARLERDPSTSQGAQSSRDNGLNKSLGGSYGMPHLFLSNIIEFSVPKPPSSPLQELFNLALHHDFMTGRHFLSIAIWVPTKPADDSRVLAASRRALDMSTPNLTS
ncbi:hypothetical protein J3458_018762 [Metarhizium acridum]|uniref:uncharacterized protein n=1 Tax=Metarhizium acridum TaxID=92637 RepID=UPI001C6B4186|nr:hypothetical protein J3458_018762 [Metarhizium acridum]